MLFESHLIAHRTTLGQHHILKMPTKGQHLRAIRHKSMLNYKQENNRVGGKC